MDTDWFQCASDVCQGNAQDMLIAILLYVDDIVLLAETEHELQTMLNKLTEWCYRWNNEHG